MEMEYGVVYWYVHAWIKVAAQYQLLHRLNATKF